MVWLAGWSKRRQISVAAADVDANLTNFPVRVQLGTSQGKTNVDVSDIFDELGASSLKIAFALDNETGTQLYAEVVYWNDTGENAEIWVRVPSLLAASGGIFYVYYDSTQTDNTTYIGAVSSTPGETVWDSNFVAVMHLAETTGSYLDSTDNSYDGAADVNSRTRAGIFDNDSPDFVDGQLQEILITDGISLAIEEMTLEALVNPDNTTSGHHVIIEHDDGDNNWYQISREGSEWYYRWSSTGAGIDFNFGTANIGSWEYLVGRLCLTAPNEEATGWENGVEAQSETAVSAPTAGSGADFYIGRRGSQEFDGVIDEIRISNTDRSDAWISATNDTLRDNFTTWGVAENDGWQHIINGVSGGKVNEVLNSNIANINEV